MLKELTDLEIVGKFKRAGSKSIEKKECIEIMADLCCCEIDDIRNVLLKNGIPECDLPKKRGRKPKTEVVNGKEFEKAEPNELIIAEEVEDDIPVDDTYEDCATEKIDQFSECEKVLGECGNVHSNVVDASNLEDGTYNLVKALEYDIDRRTELLKKLPGALQVVHDVKELLGGAYVS